MTASTADTAVASADSAELANLIRARRTINAFLPERPPRALMREALDLARWAPNHHLTEPWHFYLIGERTAQSIVSLNTELVRATSGDEAAATKYKCWAAIPGWLVVTQDRVDDVLRDREDYAACATVMQNLALYLWSRGVGMKWTTGAVTRDPRFYELLWIDPGIETVVGLVWYGYPAECPPAQRRSLDSHLVELP